MQKACIASLFRHVSKGMRLPPTPTLTLTLTKKHSMPKLPQSLTEWVQQCPDEAQHLPLFYHSEDLPRLTTTLKWHLTHTPVLSTKVLYSLAADLITMELFQLALELIDAHQQLCYQGSEDFHALSFEGMVCYMAGAFSRAEIFYKKAHHLLPTEPAPYVNLVEIFFAEKRWKEAEEWLDAGLNTHPNYPRLWEQQYLLCTERQPDQSSAALAQHLDGIAQQKNSWYGGCVAIEVRLAEETEERLHEAQAHHLGACYSRGENDDEFLIEYTGYLGASGQYTKLLQVLWQAKPSGTALPWKLDMHAYQALEGLERSQEAQDKRQLLLQRSDLPTEVRSYLQNLKQETASQSIEDPKPAKEVSRSI